MLLTYWLKIKRYKKGYLWNSNEYIRYRKKPEQFDENAFLSDLVQHSWSNINSYGDTSAAVQFVNDTFLSLLDKHASLKETGKKVSWLDESGNS